MLLEKKGRGEIREKVKKGQRKEGEKSREGSKVEGRGAKENSALPCCENSQLIYHICNLILLPRS